MAHRLLIGGTLTAARSGRTYPVSGIADSPDGHRGCGDERSDDGGCDRGCRAAAASADDARRAVAAARSAASDWAARSGLRRGATMYRVAEVMAEHRRCLGAGSGRNAGADPALAWELPDATIERWVWYAGWSDKLASPRGTGLVSAYNSYSNNSFSTGVNTNINGNATWSASAMSGRRATAASHEAATAARLRCALSWSCWPKPLPIFLSEKSQQIADQQDQQHRAKPDACASARAPPTVAVVSSAQAENQHKNNDEYEHFRSPLIWGYYPKVMQPI